MAEDSAVGYEIVTLSATDEDDGIHGVVFYTIDKITTSKLYMYCIWPRSKIYDK